MSIAILDDYNFYMPASTGFSEAAISIKEILDKFRFRNEDEAKTMRDISLEDANDSLDKLRVATSQADWDGYGAAAIPLEAFTEAFKLISLLPSSIPMPEMLPEPGGEIGLEWYCGKGLVFVTSVSGKHRINYAGIFGDNKTHGTEYFGESLPTVLMANLRRLYYH